MPGNNKKLRNILNERVTRRKFINYPFKLNETVSFWTSYFRSKPRQNYSITHCETNKISVPIECIPYFPRREFVNFKRISTGARETWNIYTTSLSRSSAITSTLNYLFLLTRRSNRVDGRRRLVSVCLNNTAFSDRNHCVIQVRTERDGTNTDHELFSNISYTHTYVCILHTSYVRLRF